MKHAYVRVTRLDITPALRLSPAELRALHRSAALEARRVRRAARLAHAGTAAGFAYLTVLGYLALVLLWP